MRTWCSSTNPRARTRSARYHAARQAGRRRRPPAAFDLARLPASVEKIVVALTEDGGGGFAAVSGLARRRRIAAGRRSRCPRCPRSPPRRASWWPRSTCATASTRSARTGRASPRGSPAWPRRTASTSRSRRPRRRRRRPPPPPPPPPPAQSRPPAAATAGHAAPAISFKKVSGQVNLKKGDKPVIMEKTALITASVNWRSGTDYDVYALVMTKDGKQIDVATFGADGVAAMPNYGNGAVKHLGDVKGSARRPSEQTRSSRSGCGPTSSPSCRSPTRRSPTARARSFATRCRCTSTTARAPASTSPPTTPTTTTRSTPACRASSATPTRGRHRAAGALQRQALGEPPGAEARARTGEVTVVMDAGPRNKYK